MVSTDSLPAAQRPTLRRVIRLAQYGLLIMLALTMLVPFAWMLSTSLKPQEYILSATPELIPSQITLQSYVDLFTVLPIGRMFLNSILVAVLGMSGQIAISAMAAYAFSRIEWRGRDVVFVLYLATMMIPGVAKVLPQFVLISKLGWMNTYQALILPGMFSAFGVFLLRQAFLSLPRDLDEAAFIDGANHLVVFWRIIIPLVRPALATLAVFSFMDLWNAYLWPLFVARKDAFMTLPVGLANLQGGPRSLTKWNVVMAGAVVSVVPILVVYLFAQKWFFQSVVSSGIKG
jgi:multiple sugar transport system permease protein